jgi:hypothetical protein
LLSTAEEQKSRRAIDRGFNNTKIIHTSLGLSLCSPLELELELEELPIVHLNFCMWKNLRRGEARTGGEGIFGS